TAGLRAGPVAFRIVTCVSPKFVGRRSAGRLDSWTGGCLTEEGLDMQGKIASNRKSFRSLLLAAGVAVAALSSTVCLAADVITMKLGTATVNDVQVEAIKRFGERVEKRSQGRIK